MFAYDKRIAQERREKDAQAGQPDAEGFVLVQRRGRKMTEGTENTRITGALVANNDMHVFTFAVQLFAPRRSL